MAAPDRDLVAALRAELAAIDPSRECDRDAERAGLEPGTRWRDATLARLAVRLARREGAQSTEPPRHFDWQSRPDHCRMAWLRGRFLARGSLSLANGQTHLEIVVPIAEAPGLAANLAGAGMPASWRVRRRMGVVTWKSAELVGLVLRRMGAGPSLLELEVRQVARALRGELNRVINAESANLTRTVAAAGRQLEAIATLSADGRLAEQSRTVREVAAARRETPEATLTELAERLSINRSAVQRALDRIERLALR
ncbi:MAG TPA: DNA-binding protein WhiA [Candidatus Limnocylindrales bacterium]|nr:DNA-binding protein WhiA [Candidatus Limnocylindrales bacterium]